MTVVLQQKNKYRLHNKITTIKVKEVVGELVSWRTQCNVRSSWSISSSIDPLSISHIPIWGLQVTERHSTCGTGGVLFQPRTETCTTNEKELCILMIKYYDGTQFTLYNKYTLFN